MTEFRIDPDTKIVKDEHGNEIGILERYDAITRTIDATSLEEGPRKIRAGGDQIVMEISLHKPTRG